MKADTRLLPELIGLELLADPKDVVRNGVKLYGIKVDAALTALDASNFKSKLAQFLGRPLYAKDMNSISRVIVAWSRARGFPLVTVAFPEQDISTGTVQIVVTVYRVGQVKVAGNYWFSDGAITDEMQLSPGDPFDFNILQSDLDRLDSNPFRSVNAVLERSTVPGATDLALHVQDRLPVRVYASYDNDGQPTTGRDRYSVGLNWGNAFDLDQQFSYQFLTTPDLWQRRDRGPGHSDDPRLEAHSATYLVPLPWGDAVTLFGTYEQQVPDVGANFDQVGHSLQASFRYDKFLPTIRLFSQRLHIGFDYKRTNNDLAFGGSQVNNTSTNVEQFLLIYDATRRDSYGQTVIENQFVYSPGGLSNGNTTALFVASGVNGARANYEYDNLQITRVTYLPWKLSSVLRVSGQIASTELLPSEQIGAGGTDSVRGYNPRAVNGTQGVLASIELHGPTYEPLHRFVSSDVEDTGQVLIFYDSGFVSDIHAQTGQPKHASLQSAGFGVRYDLARYLDFRLDYGWQLTPAPGATHTGSLLNLSVTLAY
jgi:hemolysin activation/secretion protein